MTLLNTHTHAYSFSSLSNVLKRACLCFSLHTCLVLFFLWLQLCAVTVWVWRTLADTQKSHGLLLKP